MGVRAGCTGARTEGCSAKGKETEDSQYKILILGGNIANILQPFILHFGAVEPPRRNDERA